MTPDVTRPVFVHALQDCPPVVLPEWVCSFLPTLTHLSSGWFSGTRHEMTKGHVSLTHFSVVEHLVARGEAELV